MRTPRKSERKIRTDRKGLQTQPFIFGKERQAYCRVQMKKGETAVGIIGETLFPDRGYIERKDGRVLLKHAVPGRKVEYRITKCRNGSAEGMVLQTLEPGPAETAADPCPRTGICGGCLYQTIPYEAQLEIKEKQLRELLTAACGNSFVWEGLLPSPLPERYRAKMEYTFGDSFRNGPLALGMHRRGSHYDIVTADGCRLVHEDFSRILKTTLEFFQEHRVPHYHRTRHDGYLRHLMIRRGTRSGEILVVLVTASGDWDSLLPAWKERILSLKTDGTIAGILHTRNDSVADAVIDQGTTLLYGRDYFEEILSGLRFRISPFSFFQNNSGGAELLYGKVGEYAGETEGRTVFDLYSGTGTIAQLVARTARCAVGVEIVPEAVEAAWENAARNGITNCRFIAGDVLKVLDSLTEIPDVIILDPPREGVHPKALPKLLEYGVPRIVYVSCKPTSLAREIRTLEEGGYFLKRACGVDMFPSTPNVECCALFEKREAL